MQRNAYNLYNLYNLVNNSYRPKNSLSCTSCTSCTRFSASSTIQFYKFYKLYTILCKLNEVCACLYCLRLPTTYVFMGTFTHSTCCTCICMLPCVQALPFSSSHTNNSQLWSVPLPRGSDGCMPCSPYPSQHIAHTIWMVYRTAHIERFVSTDMNHMSSDRVAFYIYTLYYILHYRKSVYSRTGLPRTPWKLVLSMFHRTRTQHF